MKLLIAFALVAAATATPLLSYEMQFEQFTKDFGRVYASPVEREQRFQNFVAFLKVAEERNLADPTAEHGITQFADWSADEFDAYLGLDFDTRPADAKLPQVGFGFVAKNMDWRDKGVLNSIKNQGSCGSCWAFSTISGIESQWKIKTGDLLDLAEQQLVDCDKVDHGCRGGLMHQALDYLKKKGSVCTTDSYKYTARGGSCKESSCTMGIDGKLTGGKLFCNQFAGSKCKEDQMAKQLETNPLMIAVDASSWSSYRGGVMTRCGSRLNHAVNAIGLGSDGNGQYWIVRNSWGSRWGESGHCKVKFGSGVCGINGYVSEATF